eukprot:m.153228 g.153228  ORF g.153228 m.153228 type:complete len:437 (-) comp16366_c2_seq57:238-1548(-)
MPEKAASKSNRAKRRKRHLVAPPSSHKEVNPNPYLHEDLQSSTKLVVLYPAVNSSGDIYHILCYLLLCRARGWYIPSVYHGYDSNDTKQQTERCRELLIAFGFGDRYQRFKTPLGEHQQRRCYRPAARETAIRQCVPSKVDGEDAVFFNQKACTALLATIFHQEKFGSVSSEIRKLLKRVEDETLTKVVTRDLDVYGLKIDAANAATVLVINHRTGYANSQHAFTSLKLRNLVKRAVAAGYSKVLVLTTGRINLYDWHAITGKGCDLHTLSAFGRGATQGKRYHMLLLLKLYNYGCRKILSCTTGTVDIAAFMGFDVYNFHTFHQSGQKHLQAQDYRVLMQTAFMHIDSTFKLSLLHPMKSLRVDKWLTNENGGEFLLDADRRVLPIATSSDHQCQHPFTCLATSVDNCDRRPEGGLVLRLAAFNEHLIDKYQKMT